MSQPFTELVKELQKARGPALSPEHQKAWDERFGAGAHFKSTNAFRRVPTEELLLRAAPEKKTLEGEKALRRRSPSVGTRGLSSALQTTPPTRVYPDTACVKAYGRSLGFANFTPALLALLACRLAYEEGLRESPSIPLEALPADVRPSVRSVYRGFRLLVACRWAHTRGAPVMFTRDFASKWCGVSEDQARGAITVLEELGLIIKGSRPGEWLPAPPRS
jgi:hypothetical protein